MKKITFYLFTILIAFGSYGQTLTLNDGPANNDNLIADPETPNTNDIDFLTTGFTMSTDAGGGAGSGGDGFIKWEVKDNSNNAVIDNGDVFTSNDPNTLYYVMGLTNGKTYTFRAELVDNSGNPLGSPVVYSFIVEIAFYNDVANLEALRSSTIDPDIYYRVLGQVINTNSINEAIPGSNFNGQYMFFQDGTAAIKVFDPANETSFYNTGEAVTNIRGKLVSLNGELLFVPTFADWGAPDSFGNSPAINTVTLSDITNDINLYQSQLVKINAATFTDAGQNFIIASDYTLSDAGGSIIFKTIFPNSDYLSGGISTIPSGQQDIFAIVSANGSTPYITARHSTDYSATLSTNSIDISGFKMFPNPSSLGYANVIAKSNSIIYVTVFDVSGKNVLSQNVVNNKLDVSVLKSGVYVLKLTQDGAKIIKRLVIQ